MNVQTMTMPKAEARAKLQAYKRRIERVTNAEHAEEYRQIADGLKQLERGRKLLDLADVFGTCPMDAHGRPMLAIARADQRQVRVRNPNAWPAEARVEFSTQFKSQGRQTDSLTMVFGLGQGSRRIQDGFALVPMIPVEHRPERFDAKAHFILWEVEAWADRQIGARAPTDPFLLRHVGGTIYAIIAEWDLTPLEKAVMNGRARA